MTLRPLLESNTDTVFLSLSWRIPEIVRDMTGVTILSTSTVEIKPQTPFMNATTRSSLKHVQTDEYDT
jgi:hypothetical protein